MHAPKHSSAWVVGLALFSMFFGSGNLIFPLFVGQLAQDQLMWAMVGFVGTAVLVPCCGVIVMVLFRGDYHRFFGLFGQRAGFWIALLLLTVWIPLGSGPRCSTLAYSSLASYLPMPAEWIWGLAYSAIVGWVVLKPNRLLDLLGYILTPLLLACLAAIVFGGMGSGFGLGASEISATESLKTGLIEGYNTMDLIAALFFSASIIGLLRDSEDCERAALIKASKACAIGTLLLGIVYVGLMGLAAHHAPHLVDVPKERLIAEVARLGLGDQFGVIAAAAVSLACFTTSVALVLVYANFLREHKLSRWPLAVTLLASYAMSTFGLNGITALTAPLLQAFYPLLILTIAIYFLRRMAGVYRKQKEAV